MRTVQSKPHKNNIREDWAFLNMYFTKLTNGELCIFLN